MTSRKIYATFDLPPPPYLRFYYYDLSAVVTNPWPPSPKTSMSFMDDPFFHENLHQYYK